MDQHVETRAREIYLDANATTPVLPQAAKAAQGTMETLFGNPSSSHVTGLRARYILESTRELARKVIGARGGKVIFTSGATEAIQSAVFSALCSISDRRDDDGPSAPLLLYGSTEHKAVPEALAHWNQVLGVGAELVSIPADALGQLDLEFIRQYAKRAAMICTMAVNNETGVIQDIDAIERAIRSENSGALWLVDSVQALGKLDLRVHTRTIDYATFSGHKVYAPKGIGLLYVRESAPYTSLIVGGGQEHGLRCGTENLPGVAALGAILRSLLDGNDETFHEPKVLHGYREAIVEALRDAFPDIVFNTPLDASVPTTLNFSVKGFPSKEILDLFDAAQIRVSSGSACSSGAKRSFVLDAMGVPAWRSESAIRLSFGPATTTKEVEAACSRIREAGIALRESCLLVGTDIESETPQQHGLIQLKRGSTCSWVYADRNKRVCFVVEPIPELAERIEHFVECQGYTVLAVLDTHSHADHTSCRPELLELVSRQVAPEARYTDALGWPIGKTQAVTLGDGTVADAMRIDGDMVLARTPLPGHTRDSQAFLLGRVDDEGVLAPGSVDFVFTGDTILIGGVGRTDFSTSTAAGMYNSLRRLAKLVHDQTIICPAHDYTNDFATTLGGERRTNPLLARVLDDVTPMSEEEFVAEKRELDAGLDDPTVHEIICGVAKRGSRAGSSLDVRPEELDGFFARHQAATLIDVREPHEYRLFDEWASLGLDQPPRNVPLSKFSDFLRGFLAECREHGPRDIIFICRSGNRSGLAAESLRRMGIETAWHIAGGVALGGGSARTDAVA